MFVTYAYGGDRFVKLALLALLSIRARLPGAELVVHTDQPEAFAGYGFTVHFLSKVDIVTGRGAVDYPHRVKIELLLRHALENPEGTPVIYIDSDTYYRGGVAELGDRPWVMSHLDGLVGESFYTRFHRFLSQQAPEIAASAYRGMAPGFKMYNSGLVAFPAGLASARLLQAALRLNDWLCVRLPEQNDFVEQIALAWVGESGPGVAVDAMGFDHYWPKNTELAALVAKLDRKEIAAVAADPARFDQLLREAEALQTDRWHRLTVLRKKRWDRSLKKRRNARKLRTLRDGA